MGLYIILISINILYITDYLLFNCFGMMFSIVVAVKGFMNLLFTNEYKFIYQYNSNYQPRMTNNTTYTTSKRSFIQELAKAIHSISGQNTPNFSSFEQLINITTQVVSNSCVINSNKTNKYSTMKKLLIFLVMLMSTSLFAQQDALFSQYMFNKLTINPGYAGSRELLSADMIYRYQWVNIEGAPKTVSASIHSPLNNPQVALGFNLSNDKIG